MPMPTRFGHEFSGDVAAVGDGVTAFAPGDAVMCVHTGALRRRVFGAVDARRRACASS